MMTKSEIEEAIRDKGDFVKIDYLNRYLKKVDSLEMKRFILLNLASVNESRGLFNDAIKNVSAAGDISITFREKRDLYMKEVALWIKISDFMMAEKAFNKTLSYGNENDKLEIYSLYEETFRAIGKNYENQGKLRKALEVYDRLFNIVKIPQKKEEVKNKLLDIYSKLGRTREYNRLKGIN